MGVVHDERTKPSEFQCHRPRSHLAHSKKHLRNFESYKLLPRSIKPCIEVDHEKRTKPTDFQGHWSKIKVTYQGILLSLAT